MNTAMTQPDPIQQAMEARGMTSPKPQVPQAQPWVPQDQEGHIVAALTEHLKNTAALKKEQLKMQQAKIQQPAGPMMPVAQTTPAQAVPPTPGSPALGGGGFSVPSRTSFQLPSQPTSSTVSLGMTMPTPVNQQQNPVGGGGTEKKAMWGC